MVSNNDVDVDKLLHTLSAMYHSVAKVAAFYEGLFKVHFDFERTLAWLFRKNVMLMNLTCYCFVPLSLLDGMLFSGRH